MSGQERYRAALEEVQRKRARREQRRRRSWPFPPDRFVRASELLEADRTAAEEARP